MIADLHNPETRKPTRDGFGKGLLELGEKDENVWALTADVSGSTRTNWFAEKYPKRFVQVGVAEQNMVGVASGIASLGKTVFVSAFGAFSPGRNWDQIRVSVCYNDVNVNFHASHTGITVGPDGASHQVLEDIAIVRSLPNIIVMSPADAEETCKATLAAAAIKTPCYIRTSRQKVPVFTTADDPFEIGKANVYREGSDVAIFAHGIVVYDALMAAEKLKEKGIDAAVVDCHTIKPIDEDAVLKYAKDCGLIVSVEDHQVVGGLGSAISETVSEKYPIPVKRHGIYNRFCESASANELLKKYMLDTDGIAKTVEESMKMKK
ncbi:transketolase family protein [Candidatus Micrarchaeota archaeon]|nr:transketolase family protein [Candidatus Micrarchaeota archaeon]MBU1681329.1 transketolase family protein [Candidatus Micrarchaeota archaeon]